MARIDFKAFEVWDGVAHRQRRVVDVREAVADLVYQNAAGIRGLTLAQKVYGSDGPLDFTDEETGTIKQIVERLCIGAIVDGLHEQIANEKKEA